MTDKKYHKPGCIIFVLGVVAVAGGIGLSFFINGAINSGLAAEIIVDSPQASSFNKWVNNSNAEHPVHVYNKVYMYNISNPSAVLAGSKPHLAEIGPFVYEEFTYRSDVSFEDGGTNVKFKEIKEYIFRRELSIADENEVKVTSYNLVFQGVFSQLRGSALEPLIPALIYGGKTQGEIFFVTKTVHELMWGYPDPVLEMLHGLDPQLCPLTGYPGLVQNASIADLADTPFNRCSTGKKKGSSGVAKDATYYNVFQNMSSLAFWGNSDAQRVRGSNGDQFSTNLQADSTVAVLVDLAKKAVDLERLPQLDSPLYDIPLWAYGVPDSSLMNSSVVPDNAGFYNFGPAGLWNLTVTQRGIPIFMSWPHFLDADPRLPAAVTGVSAADPQKHKTILDIEPISGTTMRVRQRFQVNAHVGPISIAGAAGAKPTHWFTGVAPVYGPIMWLERSGHIPSPLASQFHSQVLGNMALSKGLLWGGSLGGGACCLLGLALLIFYRNKDLSEESIQYIGYERLDQYARATSADV